MSLDNSREPHNQEDAEEGLKAVEELWKACLPEYFRCLYSAFAQPFLAPCEFFTLDAIRSGCGRGFGMVPQFMPFGRAVGEGGLYGFYITPDTARGYWPVLYWDEDERYLRPVCSNFEAFLRYCILVGRYETEPQFDDVAPGETEPDEQQKAGRLLKLDTSIVFGELPRNDTELYERLVKSDPQDAASLCHLGCVGRSRGDSERALDFYHRAIEAAPWFGDSRYLLADTYRDSRNDERAVQNWWAVVQRLLPLCTRTWEWNLGENHPEGDVYEVAADALAQYAEHATPEIVSTPLWNAVVHEDPYDPDVRESLGSDLLTAGDALGAEREYLNALSLCCFDRGRQPERLYALLHNLYEQQGRTRDVDTIAFDSRLPRPGSSQR